MFTALKPDRLRARATALAGDGTSVLLSTSVTQHFLRLGQNLVLTRLLSPEAFGIVGILTSIMYVLTMMSDLGLRPYITRHKTADDELLKTVWTVRLIRCLVLAFLMVVGADALAGLYNNPEIALAVAVSAGLYLIEGATSLSLFTAERNRRVSRLSMIDFGQMVFTMIVMIVAAIILRSYWALVIGTFSGALWKLYASYFLVPSHPIGFSLKKIHLIDLWAFSRYMIPSSILTIILTQTDRLLLANFFPIEELGKFTLAAGIVLAPNRMIQQYVMRVFYPKISAIHRENPEGVASNFYSSRLRLTVFLAFCLGGAMGASDLAIKILFDNRYAGAGFYLALLMVDPIVKLLAGPTEMTLVARGWVKIALIITVLKLAWLIVAGPLGYWQFGPMGLIVAICLMPLSLLPFYWYHSHRNGLLKPQIELGVLAIAGAGFAIGWLINSGVMALVANGSLPDF